jgi:hypothetical protein
VSEPKNGALGACTELPHVAFDGPAPEIVRVVHEDGTVEWRYLIVEQPPVQGTCKID